MWISLSPVPSLSSTPSSLSSTPSSLPSTPSSLSPTLPIAENWAVWVTPVADVRLSHDPNSFSILYVSTHEKEGSKVRLKEFIQARTNRFEDSCKKMEKKNTTPASYMCLGSSTTPRGAFGYTCCILWRKCVGVKATMEPRFLGIYGSTCGVTQRGTPRLTFHELSVYQDKTRQYRAKRKKIKVFFSCESCESFRSNVVNCKTTP